MSLTPRQRDALAALERLTTDGVAPSYEELGDAIGLPNKSGVHRLVTGLEARGYLRRMPHLRRTLELTDKAKTLLAAGTKVETPTLLGMATPALGDLIARACGVYAHRVGGGSTDSMLNRIGARLAGRPVDRNGP